MTKYITRAYNSFTFNHRDSTITKFSKEERLVQETEYYKNLPSKLSIFFPRLINSGSNLETKEHFLELELYPYKNLGNFLIEGKLTKEQWTEIAEHLSQVLSVFNQTGLKEKFTEDLNAMYIEKTETEYKKLVEGFGVFTKLSQEKKIVLNGIEYENFEVIWPKIKEKYLNLLINSEIYPSVIHGDFCFSNILAGFLPNGKSILRFVDPRGKFGKFSVFGDPYYDLAKLMHSTDVGYEYFIYDKFEVSQIAENKFSLIYANSHKIVVNKIFYKGLYSNFDPIRIKLIQATIYIGMCARHYDSDNRQLAMYLSGVKLLNEVLNGK